MKSNATEDLTNQTISEKREKSIGNATAQSVGNMTESHPANISTTSLDSNNGTKSKPSNDSITVSASASINITGIGETNKTKTITKTSTSHINTTTATGTAGNSTVSNNKASNETASNNKFSNNKVNNDTVNNNSASNDTVSNNTVTNTSSSLHNATTIPASPPHNSTTSPLPEGVVSLVLDNNHHSNSTGYNISSANDTHQSGNKGTLKDILDANVFSPNSTLIIISGGNHTALNETIGSAKNRIPASSSFQRTTKTNDHIIPDLVDIFKDADDQDDDGNALIGGASSTSKHIKKLQKNIAVAQTLRDRIAKTLLGHCGMIGEHVLSTFVAMDRIMSRIQHLAHLVSKKYDIPGENIEDIVREKEDQVIEKFLRDVFVRF